jgi:hypothetical protein
LLLTFSVLLLYMVKRRWVPEAVLPAVEFLNRTDFKLQDWDFYKVRSCSSATHQLLQLVASTLRQPCKQARGSRIAPAMLACFDGMMLVSCQRSLALYVHPSPTCRTTLLSLQSNLQQYVENKYVTESTGFKALPEIINGRAAMIGECDTALAGAPYTLRVRG